MANALFDLSDDELADLRAGYNQEQQAARQAGNRERVWELREKKMEIQREIDRRQVGKPILKADYVIGGAGDIKSDEAFGIIGG